MTGYEDTLDRYVDFEQVYHAILSYPWYPQIEMTILESKSYKVDFNGESFTIELGKNVEFGVDYYVGIYSKVVKDKPVALLGWNKEDQEYYVLLLGLREYSKTRGTVSYGGTITGGDVYSLREIYLAIRGLEEAFRSIGSGIVGLEYDITKKRIIRVFERER